MNNDWRETLGRDRFDRWWQGHAKINANLLALDASVLMAKGADYDEDLLKQIETDALDLERAAKAHSASCRRLAREWRAQRT